AQDFAELEEVFLDDPLQAIALGLRLEKSRDRFEVALLQTFELLLVAVVSQARELDGLDEPVGHTLHRRDDDRLARAGRQSGKDFRNTHVTLGVENAGPAELVNDPAHGTILLTPAGGHK